MTEFDDAVARGEAMARAGELVSTPFVNEPEHMRIGVNINGDGPIAETSLAFHHHVCWCGTAGCTLYEDRLLPGDEDRLLPGAEALLTAPPIDGPRADPPSLGR